MLTQGTEVMLKTKMQNEKKRIGFGLLFANILHVLHFYLNIRILSFFGLGFVTLFHFQLNSISLSIKNAICNNTKGPCKTPA